MGNENKGQGIRNREREREGKMCIKLHINLYGEEGREFEECGELHFSLLVVMVCGEGESSSISISSVHQKDRVIVITGK